MPARVRVHFVEATEPADSFSQATRASSVGRKRTGAVAGEAPAGQMGVGGSRVAWGGFRGRVVDDVTRGDGDGARQRAFGLASGRPSPMEVGATGHVWRTYGRRPGL